MEQKSFTEGGRAFILWGATLIDRAHRGQNADADGLISLLTPVIKGFLTDKGFDMTVQAQQVYGGHGYIEEWGMSQFARDARIAMIYEGANGVQALDLVGRKLAQNGGRALMAFLGELDAYIAEREGKDGIAEFVSGLKIARGHLQEATDWLMNNALENFDHAGAVSTDYLRLFGHVSLGYMWAQMAEAAQAKVAAGDSDGYYKTKLATGRYFVARTLPETAFYVEADYSAQICSDVMSGALDIGDYEQGRPRIPGQTATGESR